MYQQQKYAYDIAMLVNTYKEIPVSPFQTFFFLYVWKCSAKSFNLFKFILPRKNLNVVKISFGYGKYPEMQFLIRFSGVY